MTSLAGLIDPDQAGFYFMTTLRILLLFAPINVLQINIPRLAEPQVNYSVKNYLKKVIISHFFNIKIIFFPTL